VHLLCLDKPKAVLRYLDFPGDKLPLVFEPLGDEYNDQPAFADEVTTFITKNPELYVVT